MRGIFAAFLGSLMSWWGLWLIAGLDSTIFFFLPVAVDIVVIVLASRHRELFWLYPIIGSLGSLCGAALTYYMGIRLGEVGLEHFVSKKRLAGFRRRIEEKGAVALAILDLLPPPFPFTACILVAGALKVDTVLFFVTLGVTRFVRFGAEAVLAYFFGRQIIRWLESDLFQVIMIFFVAAVVVGTVITSLQFFRKSRAHQGRNRRSAA